MRPSAVALVNLLGQTLPDRKLVKIALLAFHGISHSTSGLIMARLQFHDQLRVQDLTESQLNALSALLSAPAAAPRPSTPLAPFILPPPASPLPPSSPTPSEPTLLARDPPPPAQDPVSNLVIEEDLRRRTRANIAHHRTIGNLTGRQHAMGLPVRGQRNKTNGKTAKRLNRIERRGFSSAAGGLRMSESSVLEELRLMRLDGRSAGWTLP
ncbi:hypothetical protein RQP46_002135 [Phenoliferia psychrophenolica]